MTCPKKPDRVTSINLILSISSRSIQDTCTVEKGLSDFHKLIFIVLELYLLKRKPNIQTFRDYTKFQNDLFRSELDYLKKKFLRENQGEFMAKKEVFKGSQGEFMAKKEVFKGKPGRIHGRKRSF